MVLVLLLRDPAGLDVPVNGAKVVLSGEIANRHSRGFVEQGRFGVKSEKGVGACAGSVIMGWGAEYVPDVPG